LELIFTDDGRSIFNWWTEEVVEIVDELGSGDESVENPWCG